MGWVYIDDIEVTSEVTTIHVDTRDFHCSVLTDDIDESFKSLPQVKRGRNTYIYLIASDKIQGWIKSLETLTGGKGTWRLLKFDHCQDYGWLKYIRMYRVSKDKFIVCNQYNEPIKWDLLIEKNLDKEHLCHVNRE